MSDEARTEEELAARDRLDRLTDTLGQVIDYLGTAKACDELLERVVDNLRFRVRHLEASVAELRELELVGRRELELGEIVARLDWLELTLRPDTAAHSRRAGGTS